MAINERKHPDVLETNLGTLNLTDTEQDHYTQLRASLSPQYDHLTDFTLYRFLKVNSFHVEAARKQFIDYIHWRANHKLDTVLDTIPNKIDVIRTLVPHAYHGFDLAGRPIYIEKTGKIHCAALADESVLPRVDFINSHMWGVENLMRLAHESSLRSGKRVETFTSIIDMNGLGFSHRTALPLLNQCMTLDSTYYPEFIGKLFVLNTPWVAPMMYNMTAPFVPAEIRSRVYVLKDVSELHEHADPSQIPVELGGTCQEHGGKMCVPEPDATAINALVQTAHDDGLEKVYVSTDYEKLLDCDEKGATFTWFFECDEGYDIDFSVQIIDTTPDAPKKYAKIPSRCQTNRGSYESAGRCSVRLFWDNSYSWMNGKNIKFSAHCVQIDENVHGGANVF